jgi:hypothetical protein
MQGGGGVEIRLFGGKRDRQQIELNGSSLFQVGSRSSTWPAAHLKQPGAANLTLSYQPVLVARWREGRGAQNDQVRATAARASG